MSPSEPVPTTTVLPVIDPFPSQFPTTTTPKITTLWLRYDQEMIDYAGGLGMPDFNNPRYGPALMNWWAAQSGMVFNYESEADWIHGDVTPSSNYSGTTAGVPAIDMHDMWKRNGFRFFTETAYQDTARGSAMRTQTLPPGQGLTTALPSSGMIRVTAPRDRALAVNITYAGDWSVGGRGAGGFTGTGGSDMTRRGFMFMYANHLYRSKFSPEGGTDDWSSASHTGIYYNRSVDWNSLVWIDKMGGTHLSGTGYDGGGWWTQPVTINAWDSVEPGETVHYWLARWVSADIQWLPFGLGGGPTNWHPVDGTADTSGNAGWIPGYSRQFNYSLAAGTGPNYYSWTAPSMSGQGSVNHLSADADPSYLNVLTGRSHCFQVVTF